MKRVTFLAQLMALATAAACGYWLGDRQHPDDVHPDGISVQCDCQEKINRSFRDGICMDLGGTTVKYRGGHLVIYGVARLASTVDGGPIPPNVDGIKAALASATATTVSYHEWYLAQQEAALRPDAGAAKTKKPAAKKDGGQ